MMEACHRAVERNWGKPGETCRQISCTQQAWDGDREVHTIQTELCSSSLLMSSYGDPQVQLQEVCFTWQKWTVSMPRDFVHCLVGDVRDRRCGRHRKHGRHRKCGKNKKCVENRGRKVFKWKKSQKKQPATAPPSGSTAAVHSGM